ncbi:hypothetical protein SALBM135S_08571 [Streptomyces alboniger]
MPTGTNEGSATTDPDPTRSTSVQSEGMRLASAVVYVFDLDRSVRFYRELLGLQVTVAMGEAALLVGESGSQLYLRSVGPHAPHATGGIGIQCLMWTASSRAALHRCEEALKDCDAHITTRRAAGFTWVEGRDPNGIPVHVTYPGPEQVARTEIITRIYSW